MAIWGGWRRISSRIRSILWRIHSWSPLCDLLDWQIDITPDVMRISSISGVNYLLVIRHEFHATLLPCEQLSIDWDGCLKPENVSSDGIRAWDTHLSLGRNLKICFAQLACLWLRGISLEVNSLFLLWLHPFDEGIEVGVPLVQNEKPEQELCCPI